MARISIRRLLLFAFDALLPVLRMNWPAPYSSSLRVTGFERAAGILARSLLFERSGESYSRRYQIFEVCDYVKKFGIAAWLRS